MKASKNPSKEEIDAVKQIRKYLKTDEEICSLIFTYMGCLVTMIDYFSETFTPETFRELPLRTKYAVALAINHYKILGDMLKDRSNEISIRYMPCEQEKEGFWTNPQSLSDKMVMVVKSLYKELKKEKRL